jgi:hypothetical protein
MPDGKNKIDSIASLEKVALDLSKEFGNEAMWWRGHAKACWKLKPFVYRDRPKGGKYNERALINHFQIRALGRLGHRSRPQSDLEWLFLAQHYGLPTRLLDWTENSLVALYFAVSEEQCAISETECDACLWVISPAKLNEEESNPGNPKEAQKGMVFSNEPVVQAMVMQAFGTKCKTIIEKTGLCCSALPKVLALASGDTDERIVAQSGRFTIHGCDSALEDFKGNNRYLRKFLIPANAKEQIKHRFDLMGIRRWNLFPDLQSLAGGLEKWDFTKNESGEV